VKTYNAALNRPAFQSSVWQNGDRKAPAHLANDGNFATTFRRYDRSVPVAQCSASTKETNPWWAVDLGRPMAVYRVDLTNRGDGAGRMTNANDTRSRNRSQKPSVAHVYCDQTAGWRRFLARLSCSLVPNFSGASFWSVCLWPASNYLSFLSNCTEGAASNHTVRVPC